MSHCITVAKVGVKEGAGMLDTLAVVMAALSLLYNLFLGRHTLLNQLRL